MIGFILLCDYDLIGNTEPAGESPPVLYQKSVETWGSVFTLME
jgi:hypothetical protein